MLTHNQNAVRFKNRISFKQARTSVIIAFFLGIIISLGQIYIDYKNKTKNLENTIYQVLSIVEQTASQSAYRLDDEFATELINGLFEYHPIYEAFIRDDAGRVLASLKRSRVTGDYRGIVSMIFGAEKTFTLPLTTQAPPISSRDMGRVMRVGELTIKADTYQTGVQFLERTGLIFFSGILRNLVLATVLLFFFYRTITKPFLSLEQALTDIDPRNPEKTRIKVPRNHEKDEFSSVVHATNGLLQQIQQNTSERIKKVAETQRLEGELNERKRREKELKGIQTKLEDSNQELSILLEDLKNAQAQLVQSEKMAALGELVASIAHEVNTPLGIGVTGATHLMDEMDKINRLYNEENMGRDEFETFIQNSHEISRLIERNLSKAFLLIKNFKTMAVDQASEERRRFNLKSYTEEVLSSLNPKLKKAKTFPLIKVNCDEHFSILSYPGYYSQIIINLVMNSVKHAFQKGGQGGITIDITERRGQVEIDFSDNGKGMPLEVRKRIFEPFYTTKRHEGGSGLGLHIVYSIIVNKLRGNVQCVSQVDKGTHFYIDFPIEFKEFQP